MNLAESLRKRAIELGVKNIENQYNRILAELNEAADEGKVFIYVEALHEINYRKLKANGFSITYLIPCSIKISFAF